MCNITYCPEISTEIDNEAVTIWDSQHEGDQAHFSAMTRSCTGTGSSVLQQSVKHYRVAFIELIGLTDRTNESHRDFEKNVTDHNAEYLYIAMMKLTPIDKKTDANLKALPEKVAIIFNPTYRAQCTVGFTKFVMDMMNRF